MKIQMRRDLDDAQGGRLAALAISATLNGALLWWMAAHAPGAPARAPVQTADETLEIVWVIRDTPLDPPVRSEPRGTQTPRAAASPRTARPARADAPAAPATATLTAVELQREPSSVGEEWATGAAPHAGPPGSDPRFRRPSAFERGGPDLVAVAPKVRLPMHDDPVLRCARLQRKLLKGEGPFGAPPATGDLLVRTMEASGCK